MNLFDVLFARKLAHSGEFPPVIKRKTGNPIIITDGADAPAVECLATVEASQDLHGYDKPWAGGAGKNKLPLVLADIKSANTQGTWSGDAYTVNGVTFTVNTDAGGNITSIKATGTATANANINLGSTPSDGQYILNGCPNGGSDSTYFIYVNTIYRFDYGNGVNVNLSGTSYDVLIQFRNGQTIPSGGLTFYPMLRLSTESDSTFTPYSNICPISGMSEVGIGGCGKNINKPYSYSATIGAVSVAYNGDGTVTFNGTANVTSTSPTISVAVTNRYNYIIPAGTYTPFTTGGEDIKLEVYKTTNSQLLSTGDAFTLTDETSILFRVGTISGKVYNNTTYGLMLVRGSSSTDYEPYTPNNYTIDLNGTRYGCEVDVVRGKMRVTHGFKDLGDLTYTKSSTAASGKYRFMSEVVSDIKTTTQTVKSSIICSQYETKTALDNYNNPTFGISVSADGKITIVDENMNEYTDIQVKTALEGIQAVYELATPIEVSLSPTAIRTLSGDNYISTNAKLLDLTYITENYQDFVDTVEQALPSTRKGGTKPIDIFQKLEGDKEEPEKAEEEEAKDEKEEVKK